MTFKPKNFIDANELREEMYKAAFETDSDLQRWDSGCWIRYKLFENVLDRISSKDTLYGYRLEHLATIANILQNRGVSPEKLAEILEELEHACTAVQMVYEKVCKGEIHENLI